MLDSFTCLIHLPFWARIEGALQRVFDLSYCVRTALAVLPAVAWYLYSGDLFVLKAALIGVYLLIVSESLRPSGLLLLMHAAVIGISIGLFCLSFAHAWVFVPLCAGYAAMTHGLARWGEGWRSISVFSFIPALYLGCELNAASNLPLVYLHLLRCYPFAVIPVMLVSLGNLFYERRVRSVEVLRDYCRWRYLLPRQKVTPEFKRLAIDGAATRALAVLCAAVVVEQFHLDAGEWLIWSAASVSTGALASTGAKHRDRLWGAFVGVSLGVAIAGWVPASAALYGFAVLGVSVSIATLRNYRLAFALRCCLCVVCAAALGQGSGIGWLRLSNVVLGGLIGVGAMYMHHLLMRRWLTHSE